MIRNGHPPKGESGYAMVAAVASLLVFSLLALKLTYQTRAAIVSAAPDVERVQADAAAQAGFALAMQGLLNDDPAYRLPIDGRTLGYSFDGARISVRIEDERGKVPLNILDDDQVTRLLKAAGLDGERLAVARDSLLDWQDDDDEARENGAEFADYRGSGIRPRNGSLLSVNELAAIRGFDHATIARLAPLVTVDFGSGPFDARFSVPRAAGVMYGAGSIEEITRNREQAGQRTALSVDSSVALVGRPLTVESKALLPGGAAAVVRCVVELTGAEERPYVVRSCA